MATLYDRPSLRLRRPILRNPCPDCLASARVLRRKWVVREGQPNKVLVLKVELRGGPTGWIDGKVKR